ncbi:putative receptor-like protein kinase At4g00960 [Triticum dicoccoides]|uniref:putative receptor-like protein kinase At4g00960 n=1 Tax=Triticum dicoccoides TaxID=85692 RepID=UPI00189123F6|nr:putative receptor-like protein kinase At4g00960 [Triticum dicoccoides]
MERAHNDLEKKLEDSDATPVSFSLEFLKAITCDFSTELVLGEGGFGVVYKGVLPTGETIAVKKLFEIQLKEEAFQNEVCYLMGIKHQNVVQLLGYCAESKWEAMEYPIGSGKHIFAESPKRLLCFEYVSNKSLDKHISDESSGLEWNVRYEIIKGICNGLHYLHEECRIVHLDLKPQNILMDSTMIPKIADFGLSRIFGEKQTQTVTNSRVGTCGYMAPECINQGVLSKKADIFSLGVIIIEIITGGREYPNFQHDIPHHIDPSFERFIEKVAGCWRNKFASTPKYKSDRKYSQQVKDCVTVALKCVDPSRQKRPSTKDVIQGLNAVDQMEAKEACLPDMQCTDKMLTRKDIINDRTDGKVADGTSSKDLSPTPSPASSTQDNENYHEALKESSETSHSTTENEVIESPIVRRYAYIELCHEFEPNY